MLSAHTRGCQGHSVPSCSHSTVPASFHGRTLSRGAISPIVGPRCPARRLVIQAAKLATLRKKMWREAGPPPDLATRLFSERIIYVGMPLDSSVAELLTAQLMVLVQDAPDPIYMYINSTGIAKSNTKFGNEHEAIAVYNMMMGVKKFCPIYTLCVGNAYGEAALLLSAGSKDKRAALPSANIMIRQPLQRLSGMQASDIDIYRKITREKTSTMAKYLAFHTGHSEEEVMRDFARPRYFSPIEAQAYGIIDKVLEPSDRTRMITKDWDSLDSEISELGLMEDADQPLPSNIMYPGTSQYWRSDFDGYDSDDEDEEGSGVRPDGSVASPRPTPSSSEGSGASEAGSSDGLGEGNGRL